MHSRTSTFRPAGTRFCVNKDHTWSRVTGQAPSELTRVLATSDSNHDPGK
jgi:hypothetical protein